MVAGHLQTKKGYYYMVLNLKSEDGNRKSKWISTGIPATGKKSAKLAEEMLAETRCTYKDARIRWTMWSGQRVKDMLEHFILCRN